jgi:hypothetical protein
VRGTAFSGGRLSGSVIHLTLSTAFMVHCKMNLHTYWRCFFAMWLRGRDPGAGSRHPSLCLPQPRAATNMNAGLYATNVKLTPPEPPDTQYHLINSVLSTM